MTGVTLCFLANDSDLSSFFRFGLVSSDDDDDDAIAVAVAVVGDCSECGDDGCGFSGDLLSGEGPRSKSSADDTDGRSTVCCGVPAADEPRRLSPLLLPRPQLRRRRLATESDWLSSALAESYAAPLPPPLPEFFRDDDVDSRRSRSSAMDVGNDRFLSAPLSVATSHGHTSSAAACSCNGSPQSSTPLRLSLRKKSTQIFLLQNSVRPVIRRGTRSFPKCEAQQQCIAPWVQYYIFFYLIIFCKTISKFEFVY